MEFMLRIVGAMLFAYFGSRILMRVPNPLGRHFGLVLVHGLCFAGISLLVILMRAPLDVFQIRQLMIFGLAQTAWLIYDLLRGTFPPPMFRA